MRGVRGGHDFGGAEGVLFLLFIYLLEKARGNGSPGRGGREVCGVRASEAERLGLCRHKVKLTGCIG